MDNTTIRKQVEEMHDCAQKAREAGGKLRIAICPEGNDEVFDFIDSIQCNEAGRIDGILNSIAYMMHSDPDDEIKHLTKEMYVNAGRAWNIGSELFRNTVLEHPDGGDAIFDLVYSIQCCEAGDVDNIMNEIEKILNN